MNMGYKPGDKIDLESINRREKKFEERRAEKKERKKHERSHEDIILSVDQGMRHSVPLIQERAASYEGAPVNLLDDHGAINPNAFIGVYSKEEILDDIRYPLAEKKCHYQTDRLDLQKKHNTKNQDKLLRILEREERMRDGNISEDLLFLLLNKISGDRYMVMKSCMRDDFSNGTDLLLVDTQTGAAICAFDATVSGFKTRKEKKNERVQERLKKGEGMNMKYGVTFNENKMILGEINQIPPLLLDLNRKQLITMLQKMDFNIDSSVSDIEQETIISLVSDVENQIKTFDSDDNSFSYDAVYDFINHIRSNLDFVQNRKAA